MDRADARRRAAAAEEGRSAGARARWHGRGWMGSAGEGGAAAGDISGRLWSRADTLCDNVGDVQPRWRRLCAEPCFVGDGVGWDLGFVVATQAGGLGSGASVLAA